MNGNYERWIAEAEGQLAVLNQSLEQHGGDDLIVPYQEVAFAFPSREPNPSTIDYPLIDRPALAEWSNGRGWEVRLAPENQADDALDPPVRFTRNA